MFKICLTAVKQHILKNPRLTEHLKRMIHDSLGYGLALEGMAVADGWENADPSEIELDEPRKS